MNAKPKVVIIVGPTASGKTSLGIHIAERQHGEIISADSRQVYRGLNFGTGKVTVEEMHGIPHHLLDIADPRETYTAHDFVRDGRRTIADIISRGKLPVIVGGTFLYIDALIGKVTLPDTPPNPLLRKKLEELDTNALYALLKAHDPAYAMVVDKQNPRRLVRALEIIEAQGHMPTMSEDVRYDVLTIGIQLKAETLHTNIHTRLEERLAKGMVDEVRTLHQNGLSYERMEDLGLEYRYIARHLQGTLDYETMCRELETKIRQYAKRQMTWLKRDKSIVWVETDNQKKIETIVREFMQ